MKMIAPKPRGTTATRECECVAQSLVAIRALLNSATAVLFASDVVHTFPLAFEQLSPNVWETWLILTR